MTIQTPTADRPRPGNIAPPAREDREFKPERTPGERRAYGEGYRLGRHRGRIDAWQEWTGHQIPGADPIPDLELAGWADVWAAVRRLIRQAVIR